MSLISLRQLLDHAAEYSYCIPAFNVCNLEQIIAVMEAAKIKKSPVIIQVSSQSINYSGFFFIKYLFLSIIKSYPKIPICLHQDHALSSKTCSTAIKMGVSSIMIDGSLRNDNNGNLIPSGFAYNLKLTKKISKMAHKYGISVEGELGCLGSLETFVTGYEDEVGSKKILTRKQILTDPTEAVKFVKDTNIDALAISVGTSHGINKFTIPPNKKILCLDNIKKINKVIPNTHLVIHGASSIDEDLINTINNYGGKIKKYYGIPTKKIIKYIKYGVRKINIDTDLRLAATGAIRKFLYLNKNEVDHRKIYNASKLSMSKICQKYYDYCKSSGMAEKIIPLTLKQMKSKYINV